MPQTPAEKSFFSFRGGLISEASELNFPEETMVDGENFILDIDGSLKRRRGLRLEEGGALVRLQSGFSPGHRVRSYVWRDVNATTDTNFIVQQIGQYLYFFEDTPTATSTTVLSEVVDLGQYAIGSYTSANISMAYSDFTTGQGYLFVANPFMTPLRIAYDPSTGDMIVYQLNITVRDFEGVDDGVANTTKPTTLSAAHEYNLKNRGWSETLINQYFTDASEYPSKNMIYYDGYRKQTDVTYADEDGIKEWDTDKIAAEVYGDSSGFRGALKHNPFDTTYGSTADSTVIPLETGWTRTDLGSTWTIELQATGHGYSNGDTVQITNFTSFITTTGGFSYVWSYDGSYTIANVVANTFEITVQEPWGFASFDNQELTLGFAGKDPVTNPVPFVTDDRPTAIQWYEGRVFYAGTNNPLLRDRIFFSRIALNESDYTKCFQEADPTAPTISELLPDDGGVIVVSDLGTVLGMEQYQSSLIIFTTNGLWELSGSGGIFSADSYRIRKLTDVECTSGPSIVRVEDSLIWTGPRGIFAIFQDPRTGFLTTRSLVEESIQTLWANIDTRSKDEVKGVYDSSRKRVYFLYRDGTIGGALSANMFDTALVYDIRLAAFYKLTFDEDTSGQDHLIDGIPVTDADESTSNQKVKFTYMDQSGGDTDIAICDFDQTLYTDYPGGEKIPFIITGYDNLGDWQRFKQAPKIHTFMKKTETGYTASGTDLVPVNESSLTLQARWDWTDNANSGKIGTAQQIYRHRRRYQPVDVNDTFDDGEPVVVARNKVRGRGRALNLKFTGEAGKDAHLLGWTIQYVATRKL